MWRWSGGCRRSAAIALASRLARRVLSEEHSDGWHRTLHRLAAAHAKPRTDRLRAPANPVATAARRANRGRAAKNPRNTPEPDGRRQTAMPQPSLYRRSRATERPHVAEPAHR